MMIIGLTGGIASGKSTVARIFREAGIPVIDADEIARELVQPGGETLPLIAARFGEEMLLPDGNLNRPELAALVFANAPARQDLDAIMHPLIMSRLRGLAEVHRRAGARLVIFEAALLAESGAFRELDGLIAAVAPRATQKERLIARDGFSPAEAEARLNSQADNSVRQAAANYVIDTNVPMPLVKRQVAELVTHLSEISRSMEERS